MNAIKFIKDHGVEKARAVLSGAPEGVDHYCADNYWSWDGRTLRRSAGDGFFIHSIWGASAEWKKEVVDLSDLKRLVESVDIITKVGGIREAIEEHTKWMHAPELHLYRIGESVERLKQAIADYESIYGGEHV